MDNIKVINNNRNMNSKLLNNIKNGRINIMGNPISSDPLFLENNKGNTLYKQEALKSILSPSPLHNLFFSKTNIDHLQHIIRKEVWLQSNKKHLIARQSDNELKIIMRSIYLQNGKHLNYKCIDQIKKLNSIVLNYSIKNILVNIEQYIGYKKHVSNLPVPLSNPKNMSISGLKKYI
jgi:hypothetical protein